MDLTRRALRELHDELRRDVVELTPEELWWQAAPGINTPGFHLWHLVRDEDHVINVAVLRRTTVWEAGHWGRRLNLEVTGQGTGFSAGEAAALRYELAAFREYAEAVWSASESALETADASVLDGVVRWPDGELPMSTQLHSGMIGHAWLHLGEIRCLRGLQGWRGRE